MHIQNTAAQKVKTSLHSLLLFRRTIVSRCNHLLLDETSRHCFHFFNPIAMFYFNMLFCKSLMETSNQNLWDILGKFVRVKSVRTVFHCLEICRNFVIRVEFRKHLVRKT
ncbi:hypothetical protein X975_08553, partial [Stegodyphus mimosarum]